MDKWIIKKPKVDKDQNFSSISNANYNNNLLINSRDKKRPGINETN